LVDVDLEEDMGMKEIAILFEKSVRKGKRGRV
jgi:hypothetical protein